MVERACRLFDEVVLATVRNPQKSEPLFDLEERKQMLEEATTHLIGRPGGPHEPPWWSHGVAHDVGASAIVKGLRAVSDFESELQMAQMNRQLSGVEDHLHPRHQRHSPLLHRLAAVAARWPASAATSRPSSRPAGGQAPGGEVRRRRLPPHR